MTVVEEWDRAFLRALPLVSVSVGTLSAALGILALQRYGLAQRVYYEDNQYLVSVRYPGELHDIREFVQPDNPDVIAVYSQIGSDAWANLDFVCRNINYRRDIGEFWQTPPETLASKRGDCEDTTILLTSLLRNFTGAHVALGNYQGYGHAWCEHRGQILETTYTSARPVPDPQDYCPYVYFNDQEVVELWPGALGEAFELGRDEELKLNLIAMALADGSSNPGNYRYAALPEACICESCGYELTNPGTHCLAISCPVCGGVMWRKK